MESWKQELYASDYGQTYLAHHGIKGQQWGRRRWQNEDGTLTEEGRKRYLVGDEGSYSIFKKENLFVNRDAIARNKALREDKKNLSREEYIGLKKQVELEYRASLDRGKNAIGSLGLFGSTAAVSAVLASEAKKRGMEYTTSALEGLAIGYGVGSVAGTAINDYLITSSRKKLAEQRNSTN